MMIVLEDDCSRSLTFIDFLCSRWLYDKHAVNGGDFVYFGDVPYDPESPEGKVLIPYARAVLDAIGIRNGPSHGEVIITSDG